MFNQSFSCHCGVVVREYFFETLHNNVILSSPFWGTADQTPVLTLGGEEEQPNEQTEISDITGGTLPLKK